MKRLFSSLSGLSAPLFFALVEGLFLWVFDGDFNLLDGGYASLEAFFTLSPWVFLFFIAALCMQSLSEERQNGTLTLLRCLPLSEEKITVAKFLAVLTAVSVCLLLSVSYVLSL